MTATPEPPAPSDSPAIPLIPRKQCSIRVSAAVIVDVVSGAPAARAQSRHERVHAAGRRFSRGGERPAQTPCAKLPEEAAAARQCRPAPLGEFSAPAANEPGFEVVADVFRVDIGDQTPVAAAEIAELRWVTRARRHPEIDVAPLAAVTSCRRPSSSAS
ncbi:MAG: NUDIX hydrolase [Microbacterium sp.]